MKLNQTQRARLGVALAAVALVAAGAGYYFGSTGQNGAGTAAKEDCKVLYWYDPMVPQEKYDKPGLSSMGMQTIPKCAEDGGEAGARIDPAQMQSLGIRTATADVGTLASGLRVTGTIDFNQRNVAIVQARSGGFVQRVYGRAPGDVIGAGAPIADILVPEWGGAQAEFLAVKRLGQPALTAAARQRLRLLGMSDALIANVERSGRQRGVVTITTPIGGAIRELDVRQGMTVSATQTLAQVTGLGTVWLEAAVPEANAADLRVGRSAIAELTAYPGEQFVGRVIDILPAANTESRTLTARIELANRGGRLRPGMFATVRLGEAAQTALLVPSEAVIRTGRRTLVMLVDNKGRYRPAEVRVGDEAGGKTEILAGLAAGEKVAASGQFLLDSEASLTGMDVRPIGSPAVQSALKATVGAHRASGRIEAIDRLSVTISHAPVASLNWPAMTMRFRLADPAMARGFKTGDRVAFSFDQRPEGAVLRSLRREEAGQ